MTARLTPELVQNLSNYFWEALLKEKVPNQRRMWWELWEGSMWWQALLSRDLRFAHVEALNRDIQRQLNIVSAWYIETAERP